MDSAKASKERILEQAERKTNDEDLVAGKFKTNPYDHQLKYLNLYARKPYFALLAEMGTGKTWMIINNIADLWASGDCDAALVFAPNGVHTNWTHIELGKHMPDYVRYRAAAYVAGANKKEAKAIENLYEDPTSKELRILTMNWEALQHKSGVEAAKRFANCYRRLMIVCDESDSIKNPKALRTKNLMKLKKYSYWRRIMSGTPVNNAPFDLFAQFNFLDESILGTSSYYAFKAEYAEMLQEGNPLLAAIKQRVKGPFTPQVVAKGPDGKKKYKNLDKLSALIAPYSYRVLKKDCLDLPEKIYKTLIFRMTKQQIEAYKRAEDECRLLLAGQETPVTKLVVTTKLCQITSGYYIHPNAEEPVRIEGANPKLDILVERVEKVFEEGGKTIVWARYRTQIADIVARLEAEGHDVVQYHGGIGKKERIEAIERFERGDATVFVGNQQAGGTGITLVAASHVIYFSNDFSLRNRLQSEDRAHRIGQKKNVTYINIVAKGTIDEKIVDDIMNKKEIAEIIIDKGLAENKGA